MPTWLWRSIVGVSGTIALLSVLQWGSCTFYVMPKIWPWYARYRGTEIGKEVQMPQIGCEDASGRSVASLMALLTTLISLSRQARDE